MFKKFIFIIFLILSTTCFSQELLQKLYPNYKTIWEKNFKYPIKEVIPAKDNIIVWQNKYWDNSGIDIVSFLDIDGNILWEKTFKFDEFSKTYLSVSSISLSDNGKAVIINYFYFKGEGSIECVKSASIDSMGNKKWEMKLDTPGLIISPEGRYAITKKNEYQHEFKIYDNIIGELLWKKDAEKSKRPRWISDFLSDSEAVFLENNKLYLINLKDLNFKWELDIGKSFFSEKEIKVDWDRISINQKKGLILISVCDRLEESNTPNKYIVINNNGTIIYKSEDFRLESKSYSGIKSAYFTNDSDILLLFLTGHRTLLYDYKNKINICVITLIKHLEG